MSYEHRSTQRANPRSTDVGSVSSVGKTTLTQQLDVQFRGAQGAPRAGAGPASSVPEVAEAGLAASTSTALPYGDQIQRAFGRHDISSIAAHVGGPAGQASTQIGAEGFAMGNSVAFRSSPDLFTAAHEAAHVVQQRAGVHLKSGVGETGDRYEQHADAVAHAVVSGQSAEGLLDQMAPAGGASGGVQRAVQRVDVKVAGGNFKVDPYETWDDDPGHDTDKNAGLNFDVLYTPATHVVSDKIGFVQVMKCIKGDGDPLLFNNEKARATKATDGEAGWAVDRTAGKKHGNYGRNDDGSESGPAKNMTFGSRTDKTTHVDAWMHDRTNLPREAGKTFTCDAHIHAVDIQHSEYLGAIKWGYQIKADGSMSKAAPTMSSAGAPTGFQRRAVEKWNEQADLADGDAAKNADGQFKLPLPGLKTTKTAGVWLVSNPSKYESTILHKLPIGTTIEIESEGAGKSFNKTIDKYKWDKVRVADGPHKGAVGWVMKELLENA